MKMKNDTVTAHNMLYNGGYTCVLCKGDKIYTSRKRGVKPLIEFIESGIDFREFSAADKVVGKAAAFLYVILGVDAVYADVMSDAAIYTLARHGVQPICDRSTKFIYNRDGTGLCPMEETVSEIESPKNAVVAIQNKLKMFQERRYQT